MKVVYNSLCGRYSDNPRAIYEEALRRSLDVEHVWLLDPAHAHGFPDGVRTVPYRSPEAVAELESADLVVSNTHIDFDWVKSPGTVYLQTWHGTPLKTIHWDVLWAPEGRLAYLSEDVDRWDALISPNSASTGPLTGAFRFDGEVLEYGYPRNDVLVAPGATERRARIREELGIPAGKRAVLYAPTWRDDDVFGDGPAFSLRLDLERFVSELGDDHVLLLRLHYMASDALGPVDLPGVLDLSFHPDVSDLYLAADVLVTDYSSVMFDFAATGRPILFFTYDIDHYFGKLRGSYFDLAEIAPGPLLTTSDAVIAALRSLDGFSFRYRERYEAFQRRFCHLEDGLAASRVVDRFYPPVPSVSEEFSVPSAAALPQVVILAAGMGTRLGRGFPKPLTPLNDGRTILHRQLDSLRSGLGGEVPVTLVVGFMPEMLLRAAPEVRFVYNSEFEHTNTSKSLLKALRLAPEGGVLWLNGDVVFDPRIVELLVPHLESGTSFVCVDTAATADEEVKYTLDGDGYVLELSKAVKGALGEAVGINYVSASDRAVLVEHLERCEPQDYFERGMETAISEAGLRFLPVDISMFPAVEVDMEEDLVRANRYVVGGDLGGSPLPPSPRVSLEPNTLVDDLQLVAGVNQALDVPAPLLAEGHEDLPLPSSGAVLGDVPEELGEVGVRPPGI